MYAIVRCGGRQEKVALDDVVTVDKLPGEAGSSITLPAVLVVDGDRVISDPAEVSRYQHYTQVRITGIAAEAKPPSKARTQSKTAQAKATQAKTGATAEAKTEAKAAAKTGAKAAAKTEAKAEED